MYEILGQLSRFLYDLSIAKGGKWDNLLIKLSKMPVEQGLQDHFLQDAESADPRTMDPSTDRVPAQTQRKAFADQPPDHSRGPQSKGELQVQEVIHRHGTMDPLQSFAVKLWRPSAVLYCPQVLLAPCSVERQPVKRRPNTYRQQIGDNCRALPSLYARYRALWQFGQSPVIQRSAIYSHKEKSHRTLCAANNLENVNKGNVYAKMNLTGSSSSHGQA